MSKTDNIYSQPIEKLNHFTFDEKVADVFADMINRSVPGYKTIIGSLPAILSEYLNLNSRVYDIGCSLGTSSLMLARSLKELDLKIEAIDYSSAMVEKAERNVQSYQFSDVINVQQGNILDYPLLPCDAAIMNFTLQFIEPGKRMQVIKKIADALPTGQVFIISEKVRFTNPKIEKKISDLHYEFKRANGYSELEISQKRTALEEVMITDSIDEHLKRLNNAGFTECTVWFQHFNFASFIAIK